jgi:hypothetical protein
MYSIYLGWDPREKVAFQVAMLSLLRRCRKSIPVRKLFLADLQDRGIYTRPTIHKDGRLIDVLSARQDYDGSISTEHANARFFVPLLAKEGWALFADGDILVLEDISKIFNGLDNSKAVYCVKHDHRPKGTVKMDGQVQTRYQRKNWSSVMLFNCDHPANAVLPDVVNTHPGRDLHAFFWCNDNEIGELDPRWNYLVGYSRLPEGQKPWIVHFTEGLPDMLGYEHCEFADEWRAELEHIVLANRDTGVGR